MSAGFLSLSKQKPALNLRTMKGMQALDPTDNIDS